MFEDYVIGDEEELDEFEKSDLFGPIVRLHMLVVDQDSGKRWTYKDMTALEAHQFLTFSPKLGVSVLQARIEHKGFSDLWGTSGAFTFIPKPEYTPNYY